MAPLILDSSRFWNRGRPFWIIAGTLCLLGGFLFKDVRLYFPATALITLGLVTQPDSNHSAQIHGTLILVFLVCLALPPDLSDDFHRYLWEGHVQNEGYSPYQHSPQSLYDKVCHPSEGLINNDHLPAIYPPLAQYLFRFSDLFSQKFWGWKWVLLLWCLPWLLVLPKSSLTTLYFIPAVLIEGWWNGHLDLAGIVPTLVLLQAVEKHKAGLAGFALGTVIALKIMPLIWFPFVFFYFKGKQRYLFAGTAFLVVCLCYAPYLSQGQDLFFSFVTFSKTWFFNNLLFTGLSSFLPQDIARYSLSGLFLIAYLAIFFSKRSVSQKCLAAWICLIICSPTFFPWYLLWLVPFLTQQSQKIFNLTYASAFISYWVLVAFRAHGIWQEQLWWLIPEWLILGYCFFSMLFPQSIQKVPKPSPVTNQENLFE